MRILPVFALVFVIAVPTHSLAYIAVDASRLTLCEVMLEFPDVWLLKLDKWSSEKGAYLFTVEEVLAGRKPESKVVRLHLHADGKTPERLASLKKGDICIAFFGSPDNRALMLTPDNWFLTRPDQEWFRFVQFRDDFRQLFAGSPDELARTIRILRQCGAATVPVHPSGTGAKERLFVRYDAMFPHRRWPVLPMNATRRDPQEWERLADSQSVVERQQALIALASQPGSESRLIKGLTDTHAEVRLAAVMGLATQASWSRAAIGQLVAALKDGDRFVCAFAAWGLGRANAKDHVDDLLDALGDRNYDHDFRPHRAAEAAEAILKLSPNSPAADRAVEFFLSDRMLRDQRIDSEGTRTAAARALGRSGIAARKALPELVKRLKDPLPETRIAAAEAVCLIGGDITQREKAEAVLRAEIDQPELMRRILAIRAAGAARATTTVVALRKLLDGDEAILQREAKQVLLQLMR